MSLINWNRSSRIPPIDFLLDDFFSNTDALFNTRSKSMTVPAANIIEGETSYNVELAAPGKTREDFEVNVENNVLTISSQEEETKESENKNYTRREYSYEGFKRSFRLPENSNPDEIKATYESGLLKISIPKNEETKSETRSIPVG